MKLSGDDFRLVFWVALIPAYLSIIVLLVAVKELPFKHEASPRQLSVWNVMELPAAFWWVIAIAGLLSLARFSQAFLILKAYDLGVAVAYVPMVLVVMHLVFSIVAYPFGVLADRLNRRLQLGIGMAILIGADLILVNANTIWLTVLGTALWGLQLGVTQGLLGAAIADAAPEHLRGAAFGIYDVAVGVGAFVASAGAGALWMVGGPSIAFSLSACVATAAALMLMIRPLPK